jgi:hypothetical protein
MRRFFGLFTRVSRLFSLFIHFAETFLDLVADHFADKSMVVYWFFRPKKPTLRQTEFRNATFLVLANEDIGWYFLLKKFEPNELELLERIICKDDVCVDVGANIGIYSIFMAKNAYKGRVIAFEPVPFNRNILAVNAGLNGFTNIQIHDCVLSDAVPIYPSRHAGQPFCKRETEDKRHKNRCRRCGTSSFKGRGKAFIDSGASP